MDPLNLLRELYGEDPIRRILNSGFDSPGKIAAATAESLSFFAGVQEALARQIIESAEAAMSSGEAAGAERRESHAGSGRAIQPRELPRAAAAGTSKKESSKGRAAKGELQEERPVLKSGLLDERPILDAGGLLRNLAKEPNPKQLMSDSDFLEEVGLTDAEAGFLEGISSPWSPAKERVSPSAPGSQITFEPPATRSEPLEFAPISSWSPEDEPDPVPRLVRAAELGPDPNPVEPPPPPDPGPATMPIVPIADELPLAAVPEAALTADVLFKTEVIEEDVTSAPSPMALQQPIEAARKPSKTAEPATSRSAESRAASTLATPSFWKFGK